MYDNSASISLFTQRRSAQGWANKPSEVSVSSYSMTGSSGRMLTYKEWREQMVWSCLTLSIWTLFSISRVECWWHNTPNVNYSGLIETSRWNVWHLYGGDMTPYGFCVSFLPVLLYGPTVRSSTFYRWSVGVCVCVWDRERDVAILTHFYDFRKWHSAHSCMLSLAVIYKGCNQKNQKRHK